MASSFLKSQIPAWMKVAVLVLGVMVQCIQATPRNAPFSLQAAVDELHRREAAKYPLNAPPPPSLDDWDEDGDLFGKNRNRNRHRVNKALGKYLERDEDNYGPDHNLGLGLGLGMGLGLGHEDGGANNNLLWADEKRKRFSSFRERDEQFDGPVPSVFRERENQPLNAEPAHNELAEQFLREIEEARERDAVRQWWRHLDQAKNQQDLDAESQPQDAELFEQKKRMRVPPYYLLMQKKRSYPVLPWLPYNGSDKRKRFPVAKRSTSSGNPEAPLGRTDERVAQELSELFGKPSESKSHPEEKRKRSADDVPKATTTHSPESPPATATALGDMRLEINFQRVNVTSVTPKEASTSAPPGAGEMMMHGGHGEHHGGHVAGMSPEYRHRKRSDHAHGENPEEAETDEHDEEGEESSDEDDHDEFDEEDGEGDQEAEDAEERRRKKKRAAASLSGMGGSSSKHLHAPTVGHLMLRAKKSIDWSQYFGLDRKKKSVQGHEHMKKRSDPDTSNDEDEDDDDEDSSEAEKKKRNNNNFDAEKLESMDKKLQSIEDYIIDETIKYTGAHEGLNSRDDIRRIKDHVLSRLATAYSLEKMRRALDKLRRSVDNDNHLLRNAIEPESEENSLNSNYWQAKKPLKADEEDGDQEQAAVRHPKDMEKKKRSGGYLRYPEQPNTMEETLSLGSAPYETLNDAYLGNKNYIIGSNQCPIIESMAERCRGVDLISGDINQELLPLCGVHQICYLCGASQVACDYQYLAEADGICGDNNECQSAAKSILMILRGSPGRQLGPRECLKNPCLYRAMREIGL